MNDPKTIKPGEYKTQNSNIAHVDDWGQNLLKDWCYRGTIEGQGMSAWDKRGKDLSGNDHLFILG